MWTCQKCNRIFTKSHRPHSCQKIPLEEHFKNKTKASELFDFLLDQINSQISKCQIISLPCCIHLFGKYDFLAVLPKKDRLEIRFALNRKLDSPSLKQCVPLSAKNFKNCLDLTSKDEINTELLNWLSESYNLKNR